MSRSSKSEFQLSKYEQDNNTRLPDAVKIAILLNETKGPLQQHLQLQAGNITTYGDQVLQSGSFIHQTASNRIRQQQSRTSTDGHRSIMVQQRQREEGQVQGQRKAQTREQLQLPQPQRRKRQAQSTCWTRKSFQRTRIW